MHLIIKYLLLTQLVLYYKIILCDSTKSDVQVNVEYLTTNFFENLGESISLKNEGLDDFSKEFIDTQTFNFISLMRRSHGKFEHKVTRRSLKDPSFSRDDIGVYVLNGFEEKLNVPGNHPKEIVLFQNQYETNKLWYMAVLDEKANFTELLIYKFNNYVQSELFRINPFSNDVKLAILSTLESTYIIVTEKNLEDNFHDKLGVFKFTADEELVKIQNLNNASDVILWVQNGETYMALVRSAQGNSYEDEILIYKWLGDYFDNIDAISTYGSRKITPFSIGHSHFLAIAKYRDDLGNTKTHSEIYKFNLDSEKFELHQKILTNAAVDVKHFSFTKDNMEESFIAFANFFANDTAGNPNYDTGSIIYKYVDDYFIPFQNIILSGALEWLPVSGINSEFILMVSCKFEGIKSFQYNGWQFIESGVQYTSGAFNVGVNKMSHYLIDKKPVIVVMNENDDGDLSNIFEPTFNHENMLSKFQKDSLSWCEEQIKKTDSYDIDVYGKTPKDLAWFHRTFANYTRITRDIDAYGKTLEDLEWFQRTFENYTRITRDTESFDEVNFNTDENTLDELQKNVSRYYQDLDTIEEQVQSSLRKSQNMVFQDLSVKHIVILNERQEFHSIFGTYLNEMEVDDLLNNTLDIENGFQAEVLNFDTITIQNQFPLNITNWRNFNESKIHDIVVNGDATFHHGLRIDGLLNGIDLNYKNVLLKKGDQSFNKLLVDFLDADKITAKAINDQILFQFDRPNTEPVVYNSFNVSNVILHGFINQVDIPSLNTYALKLHGDQTITAPLHFESLRANNVNVKLLSQKKIPEDLFLINEGQYAFPRDTHFSANFTAKKLSITKQLNDIKVINGNLETLMGDVDYVQHVRGAITLKNMKFINNINLTGPINDILSHDFSPVKEINKTIVLKGDYFINAGVKITEIMRTSDLLTSEPNLSVKRLQEKGLKINNSEIPVHLNFSQQLNVHEVFADKINDADVTTFILTGTNDQQVVSGRKTFSQNLNVTGSTKLYYVNGINFRDYDLAILNVHGNQTLRGKIHFEDIIANRVANIKTKFANKMWDDVITMDGNQFIHGTTIIENSSKFNELETGSLFCNSLINGFNFSKIMNGTVFRNRSMKMENLDFAELEIENLYIENYNLEQFWELINNSRFEIEEDAVFSENISIQNIEFYHEFNGIPVQKFGYQLMEQKDKDVSSPQNIKKMRINGKVILDSNLINEIGIDDLDNNTVKIDEPIHFHSVKFLKRVTSPSGIKLDGLFESLDLQDIVQSNLEDEQIVKNKIVFKEDVNVNGEIFSNRLISGFNLNQLCSFVFGSASRPLRKLVIEGNTYFSKPPKIQYINNYLVPYILNNTWFTDTEASISGNLEFGKMEFKDSLIVDGYLDEVKTQLIAQTYFSKTRNQTVPAHFEFEDDVMFRKGMSAQTANVKGEVGTINLDEFTRTVILNNFEQIFEMRMLLDTCEILNLTGDYLVNNLNFSTDVLRYDKFNMVTGKKSIRDVTTYEIKTDKPTNIQNVDFMKWLGSCILRNGTFHVPGKLKFLNSSKFLGDLNTQCPVNNLTFDEKNVMLKLGNQEISGQKTFSKNPVQFSSVVLNGLINGVNVHDLVYYQAYKDTDVAFNGPIQIDAELKAKNVNIKKRYEGVNVEQLISNITKASAVNNYQNIYDHLLKDTLTITESLKAQAFYLDYYKDVEKYKEISYIYPLHFDDDKFQILSSIYMDDQNYSVIFQVWDENVQRFNMNPELESIPVKKNLIYVKQIVFNGVDCWYMEHKNNSRISNSNQFEGGIYQVNEKEIIQLVPSIFHNGTQSVAALSIPHQNEECLLALFETKTVLFCGSANSWGIIEHVRTVNQPNGIKALTSIIKGIPYFYILSKGSKNENPSVSIWQYNTITKEFDCIQIISVAIAKDISTVSFQGVHYLAITSGYTSNVECAGSELLEIRKFDFKTNRFITSQEFILNQPLKLEFAELPTKELVLYVLSSNSQVPLQLFMYEGVSGFIKRNVALSTLIRDSVGIKSFTTSNNQHFVIIKCETEIWILQAVFKGQKYI